MIIGVAGGKGGVGKTFVSTSLALANAPLQFLDCDVEEPNAHLFLDFKLQKSERVVIPIPSYQPWKGEVCSPAADFCRTRALAVVGDEMLVFPELCTGCGGCFRICPEGVLQPVEHVVGWVKSGRAKNGIRFTAGELRVGQQRTETVIREVKKKLNPETDSIIDAPPGNARGAREALEGCDFCLLITEPTPFGLKDLQGNKALCDLLNIPAGVIVNRAGGLYQGIREWCAAQKIPILAEIPFSLETARQAARGSTLPEIDSSWKRRIQTVWEGIS